MTDRDIKENISQNLQYYMDLNGLNNRELASKLGVSESTVGKWLLKKSTPRMGAIEQMANIFGIKKSNLIEEKPKTTQPVKEKGYMTINVLGSVPAGIPIEAIEDVIDTEDLSFATFDKNKDYIGLRVTGDSMYPKYLDGDTIIIEITSDIESGQDAVVYVNGYDATLKTVKKNSDGTITLQPINPNYSPKTYGPTDDPIKILGIVKEIRRQV